MTYGTPTVSAADTALALDSLKAECTAYLQRTDWRGDALAFYNGEAAAAPKGSLRRWAAEELAADVYIDRMEAAHYAALGI